MANLTMKQKIQNAWITYGEMLMRSDRLIVGATQTQFPSHFRR